MGMKVTTILLAGVSGAYLLFLVFVYSTQHRLILNPSGVSELNPDDYGLFAEDLWIETSDGITLHGRYFPNERAELAVIFAHDDTGKMGTGIEMAEILLKSGASVLMYHHRGTGQSTGDFSEEGLYHDIEDVIQAMVREKGYEENDMVLYGRALGGAVAAYAANRFSVRGLVLESAFMNYRAMFTDKYLLVPAWLAKYEFPADRFLGEISELPVMIMHSPDDEIAGFYHGEGLYDVLGHPKMLIELNGGHTESFAASRDIIEQNWAFYIAGLCSRCRPYMN